MKFLQFAVLWIVSTSLTACGTFDRNTPTTSDDLRSATRTVILVRHAEKGVGQNPSLTETGEKRALALRDVCVHASVEAIFATEYNRTRETAKPLAKILDLGIRLVPVAGNAEEHVREVAQRVLTEPDARVILVVGHSNTVPEIIAALGVQPPPVLKHEEYDHLYVVILDPDSDTPSFIDARYGRPSDPSPKKTGTGKIGTGKIGTKTASVETSTEN